MTTTQIKNYQFIIYVRSINEDEEPQIYRQQKARYNRH